MFHILTFKMVQPTVQNSLVWNICPLSDVKDEKLLFFKELLNIFVTMHKSFKVTLLLFGQFFFCFTPLETNSRFLQKDTSTIKDEYTFSNQI